MFLSYSYTTKWILYTLCMVLFFSCNQYDSSWAKTLDLTLIPAYNIDQDQLIYQYYEKFGFTDICIHHRSYFILENFSPTQEWKVTPITQEDL